MLKTCWYYTSSSPLRCTLLLLHSDIIEYSLPKVLEQLNISHEEVKKTSVLHHSLQSNIEIIITNTTESLNHHILIFFYHNQFVDLCILLGCDYCDKIAGLGPKRALTLIQKHRTIENVVLHVNRKVPAKQTQFSLNDATVHSRNIYYKYLLLVRHIQCLFSGSMRKHVDCFWIKWTENL